MEEKQKVVQQENIILKEYDYLSNFQNPLASEREPSLIEVDTFSNEAIEPVVEIVPASTLESTNDEKETDNE